MICSSKEVYDMLIFSNITAFLMEWQSTSLYFVFIESWIAHKIDNCLIITMHFKFKAKIVEKSHSFMH